jgi:hypothetical protein
MKKVVSLFLVLMFSCFTSAHAFFGFNKKAEEPKGIEYYILSKDLASEIDTERTEELLEKLENGRYSVKRGCDFDWFLFSDENRLVYYNSKINRVGKVDRVITEQSYNKVGNNFRHFHIRSTENPRGFFYISLLL